MRSARAAVVASLAGAVLALCAAPAFAVGSVTMTSAPTSSITGWSLASTGANSRSGGSMTLSATAPWLVTVSADKSTMSEWNGSAYVSNGKALGSALTVSSARTGGTATVPGVGLSVAASTSAGTLATGTGVAVTGGTDIFSITLSQPTAITDAALANGHTYHIVLTYTAQLAL